MKANKSFQELALIKRKILSAQSSVTLEQARQQVTKIEGWKDGKQEAINNSV